MAQGAVSTSTNMATWSRRQSVSGSVFGQRARSPFVIGWGGRQRSNVRGHDAGSGNGEIPGRSWRAECLYSLLASEASLLPVEGDRTINNTVKPGVVEDRHGNVYQHLLAIGVQSSEEDRGAACPWFVECSESRSKTTLPCDPQSFSDFSVSMPMFETPASQPGLKHVSRLGSS